MGQPPKYSGKEESEFAEWAHKMQVYVSAEIGADFQPAMKWARQQKRRFSEDGEGNVVDYSDVWNDEIDDLGETQHAPYT